MKNKLTFFSAIIITIAISCNSSAQKTTINVDVFQKAIHEKNIQLLDVRTITEFNSGHILNSLQANWNDKKEFADRTSHLKKDVPVYTYCLSGFRSGEATKWLLQNGFKEVYHLGGGIVAWKNKNLPIEGQKEVAQISLKEYESKISSSSKAVLVDFGATWCPPCKKMEPIITDLVKTHGAQFDLIKIDGGDQIDISNLMQIEAFPTFIIYKNGKEVWRKQGILSKEELLKHL